MKLTMDRLFALSVIVKQTTTGVNTMGFTKGDPNINRNGRPKNAEPELLREALRREGEKRGEDFWDKVAQYAFTDKNMMIAIVKKFVPDLNHSEIDSNINVTKMPTVKIDDKEQELHFGRVANASPSSN